MIFTILGKTSTPFPTVLYLDGIDHKYPPPQQQNLYTTLDCIISNTTPSGDTEGKQICKPLGVIILLEAFPLALVSLFQDL